MAVKLTYLNLHHGFFLGNAENDQGRQRCETCKRIDTLTF
jgi:hypothetical protein